MAVMMEKQGPGGLWGCLQLGDRKDTVGGEGEQVSQWVPFVSFDPPWSLDPGA